VAPNLPDAFVQVMEQATSVAHSGVHLLTGDDRRIMVTAFHRAESLAHQALENALGQVDEKYVAELGEQLADETRHVNVFAEWETLAPLLKRDVPPRDWSDATWFTKLLINEAAGLCQFHMLAALLVDEARTRQVKGIVEDERLHIRRLVGWLMPYRDKPSWTEVLKIVGKFQRHLPRRMAQFLPRAELESLRTDMSDVVGGFLNTLFDKAG
jgi:hypothetical protein